MEDTIHNHPLSRQIIYWCMYVNDKFAWFTRTNRLWQTLFIFFHFIHPKIIFVMKIAKNSIINFLLIRQFLRFKINMSSLLFANNLLQLSTINSSFQHYRVVHTNVRAKLSSFYRFGMPPNRQLRLSFKVTSVSPSLSTGMTCLSSSGLLLTSIIESWPNFASVRFCSKSNSCGLKSCSH